MSPAILDLSNLREIGWSQWDPIGLLPADGAWDQQSFADEYDDYLRKVEGHLRNGQPFNEAVSYLVRIEREHMVIGTRPGQESRAEATVQAIRRLISASA